MSENRDYYEVLGVDRDADARTIKRAFLKKARTVHPDVSDDPEAEAKFKELNEAYSVLSDEQKRANYDRYGTADGPGGSGYVDINDIFGGMGMDDLFSSFFGGGAGGGARSRRERRRGRDMAISLSVTLEEAALGCEIEVEGIMPDEVVKVTVPAGAQYGDTVSVNNYGMPRIGGGGSRGRLIVQLRVVVPTNLSNKQRELLRAFADEMGDDVASGKKSVTDRIKSALDDILD